MYFLFIFEMYNLEYNICISNYTFWNIFKLCITKLKIRKGVQLEF